MKEKIIDFHVHAFPDSLAAAAMKKLLDDAPGVEAYLDGTLGQLINSMDRCGIEKSVLCCIATKPKQFEPIFEWCRQIRSDRIIPFPSVHPDDERAVERIEKIKDAGFSGIKFHPNYQDFWLNDARMDAIYDVAAKLGLIVVMHTGYDVAFEFDRRADCEQILKIAARWPDLKFIATHLGGWKMWEEMREGFIGKKIYTEISFGLDELGREAAREMLMRHPAEYILFGTDSPWTRQERTLELLQELELPGERLAKILHGNAERLLGL